MRIRGMTLIELVVVLAIVGILTAIALPAYTIYIQKSRRADGKGALLDLAARLERYYTLNNTYATATIAANNPATDVLTSATSPEGWYNLSLTATTTTYTLKAAPLNAQTADLLCATLTYNNQGVQNITGSGTVQNCW